MLLKHQFGQRNLNNTENVIKNSSKFIYSTKNHNNSHFIEFYYVFIVFYCILLCFIIFYYIL